MRNYNTIPEMKNILTYEKWLQAKLKFQHYAMKLPHDQHVHFDLYMNLTFPEGYHHARTKWFVPAAVIERVDALLGGHGYAIFRAWAARCQPANDRAEQ